MRTEKQTQASRFNGARSHGPATETGKSISAQNSRRHGLLASSIVLEREKTPHFMELIQNLYAEHDPQTETERCLVESMAVARWQQLRTWEMQKCALDHDIARQDPTGAGHPAFHAAALPAEALAKAGLRS